MVAQQAEIIPLNLNWVTPAKGHATVPFSDGFLIVIGMAFVIGIVNVIDKKVRRDNHVEY